MRRVRVVTPAMPYPAVAVVNRNACAIMYGILMLEQIIAYNGIYYIAGKP